MKNKTPEQKYYGVHACLAIWKKRPQDIIRVYVHESNVKNFTPVLKWCAQQKKAYHIVAAEELNRITDSVHHEGVCILAKEPRPISFSECLASLIPRGIEKLGIGQGGSPDFLAGTSGSARAHDTSDGRKRWDKADAGQNQFFSHDGYKKKICLLYLDGVQNPHNIGSILRTCAHFGIPYILGSQLPSLSPSACRIAKGGAELVRLVQLDQPLEALARLKKEGFAFIGTSSHGGVSIYDYQFPPRTILAFGSESKGMSQALLKLTTQKIQIPGTGLIESLNVSVAASLCIGEYMRQQSRK